MENNNRENENIIKLDNNIETIEGRKSIVEQIIKTTPKEKLTPKYLEILANYILFAMDKPERREKMIITQNREKTITKRETSFEGLQDQLENGEDGIYNMMTNDKNMIFNNPVKISEQDLKEIPELKKLHEAIESVQKTYERSEGRKKFLLRKQIIEMCKQQYIVKNSYKKPIFLTKRSKSESSIDLSENIYINESGDIKSTGLISLTRSKDVSNLLKNYDKIKTEFNSNFDSDLKWIISDLNDLIKTTFSDSPIYIDIIDMKIKGYQNIEIQKALEEKYKVNHSLEYISSLWRHKIPRMIADQEKNKWLFWYYKQYGKESDWKKCTRCGQMKPKHNAFFSRNATSKDGFYSICKCCRNKTEK